MSGEVSGEVEEQMTNDTLERRTEQPGPSPRTEAMLDELMPRQGPVWRRFLVGIALTVVVVAGGLAWSLGVVVPRHSAWGSYSGGSPLRLDPGHDGLVVSLYLPNLSARDLRLTGVSLDAPGVRLLDVAVEPERATIGPEDCEPAAGGGEVCSSAVTGGDPGPWPAEPAGLPATIPTDGAVWLHLLVEPTSCDGPSDLPWGRVGATFDFGDGAFPPLARTETVGRPLVEDPGDAALLAADGTTVFDATTEREAAGLLAAACRLTGTQG